MPPHFRSSTNITIASKVMKRNNFQCLNMTHKTVLLVYYRIALGLCRNQDLCLDCPQEFSHLWLHLDKSNTLSQSVSLYLKRVFFRNCTSLIQLGGSELQGVEVEETERMRSTTGLCFVLRETRQVLENAPSSALRPRKRLQIW